jgi:TetR/AcrR family acrAB operon transcriptional repressor
MKKEKSLQKKIQILQAASRLITHYGFDKTTMEEIAKEAGVSKGALYLVWSSKEALLDALVMFEMKRLLLDFQNRMTQDPQGGQIANLYKHALFALQDNPLVKALYTQDSRVLGDFVKRQDSNRYTRRILLSETAIRQMQEAGLIRKDVRPEVITYLLSVIALGFIHIGEILPPSAQPPLVEIGQALTDIVQRGFAGPGDDSMVGKQAIGQLNEFILEQYKAAEGE